MFSILSDKKLHLNSLPNRPKRKKQPPARFCDPKQIAKKSKVEVAKKAKDPKNQIVSQVQQSNSSEKLEIIHDDTFTEKKKVKAKKFQCESLLPSCKFCKECFKANSLKFIWWICNSGLKVSKVDM